MKNVLRALVVACAALSSAAVIAAPVEYDFHWTGTGGYTMSGDFTYDSASAADGFIRNGEVTSLFFQGFLNGVSIGTSSNANTLAGFNFNFNATTGQFALNGLSTSTSGQRWNDGESGVGTGLGFGAGNAASLLTLNDVVLGYIPDPVPLTATRVATVPEPATLPLVALALLAAAVGARRRSK